jgi:hypothetical protein
VEITVNGVAHELPGPWRTVPEFVRSFYASRRFPGEMIADLTLDGRATALDADDAATTGRIEVTTLPGRVVLAETAREVGADLDDLAACLRSGAEKFRGASAAQAHTAFVECVDRLGGVIGIVRSLADLARALDLDLTDSGVLPDEASLHAIAEEMIAAQEVGDWVSLADLMEYELAPAIESWRDDLTALIA